MAKARPRKAWAAACSSSWPRKTKRDLGIEALLRQPGADLADLGVGEHAVLDVGRDRVGAAAVDPDQVAGLGLGRAGDHVPERHGTLGGVDHQPVELGQVPRGQRVAGDDVDLVVGVVGAVGRDLDAVGDQADGRADRRDVGAVAGRGLAIDRELPFDAGHRPAVGDVLEAGQAVEEAAHRGDHRRQLLGLAGRDLDLHRLADRRAGVRHPRLDPDAGDVAGAPPHLGHDLFAGRPRLPVGELEHDHAHDILVDVVAAFPADARCGRRRA